MKKKGLIISTIVMVVVLIASLTTATYAWFNAQAAVSVKDVTVSVASASNISIGVLYNTTQSRSSATSYRNGTITYVEHATDIGKGLGNFTSSKSGLGTSVDWNWVLSSIGGVSSSADKTAFDTTYNPANALCNGSLNADGTTVDMLGVTKYNGNTNSGENANTVIYAPFGLRVEKDLKNYLYCDIKITPASTEFWGIVTSLKLEINDGTAHYYHPFAASSADGLLATALTYQSAPTVVSEAAQPVIFRFIIAKNTSAALTSGSTSTIYQFDIRMFLDGKDENCIADATQYGATIGIAFDAVDSTAWAALPAPTVAAIDLTA